MTYTNHSGGCPGADMTWEILGMDYGVKTIAYSFHNHVQESKTPYRLSNEELEESFDHVIMASKSLKRDVLSQMPYVQNLLSRNWFQVKNSEAIFPVGKFMPALRGNRKVILKHHQVAGGTGWAVQMAVDNQKPVFLFEQNIGHWFTYDYSVGYFVEYEGIPTLTKNFAGIGTREINDAGILAIQEIYEHNFTR